MGQYQWNTGSIYFRFSDVHVRSNNGLSANSYTADVYAFTPYFKQKFGIFYFEWELNYITGWAKKYNDAPPPGSFNINADHCLKSRMKFYVDLAPVSIGGYFVHNPGDDPNTPDKKEGNWRSGLDYDRDFNPA